ncbi:MAG: hypothetical protein U1E46_05070 [Hyphomicrobiales bacterium]
MTNKVLATLGLASCLSLSIGPASAATFNITFAENGGSLSLGSFDAPSSGGTVTAFNVAIGSITYKYLFDVLGLPPLSYDLATNTLSKNSDNPANQLSVDANLRVLAFDNGPLRSYYFGAFNPTSGRIEFDFAAGSYTIAAVPIPAALPLFATGLAAVGYVGRRRKAKAAA